MAAARSSSRRRPSPSDGHLFPLKGHTMTARLAGNPTVAAESGIADPVGSLFQSSYGRGERLIHRRRSLHGRDVFGAPGEVLGFETGRRRRQSRQSDRPGARAGRVELIGADRSLSLPIAVLTGDQAALSSAEPGERILASARLDRESRPDRGCGRRRGDERSATNTRAGAPDVQVKRLYSERREARWTNQRVQCGCPGRRPAGSATSAASSTAGRRSIACSSP